MSRGMLVSASWLLLALGAVAGSAAAGETERQAVLIQNSGWMEPFFNDPASPLVPLLGAFGDRVAIGGHVAVATFNQHGQVSGQRSPHVLYEGPFTSDAFRAALTQLDLPRRADGFYADADFQGALTGAISDLLGGLPGVIWMVTNNKNAPDNAPAVQENTRAYFRQLGESEAIRRLVAYPLRMPVTGQSYSENGLIIYGIGYGVSGGELLERLVARVEASRLFADPAVVLKPLDRVPLRFLPTRIHPTHLEARWHDGALIVTGLRGGEPAEVLVEGRLLSRFYPHVIERSTLRAGWAAPAGGVAAGLVEAAVSPASLEALHPFDEGATVTVRLRVPAIPRPSGLDGLRAERIEAIGLLQLRLDEVSLSLSPEFSEKMQALYGLDQLPALFFENQEVRAGNAQIPVRLSLAYSILPLLLLLGALGGVLVAGGAGAVWLRMPRTDTVRVGQVVRTVRLCPFQKQQLTDPSTGARVQVRMGPMGRASITDLPDGRS